MNNENDDLCVFQKIDKININNAAFKTNMVLKFTLTQCMLVKTI